MYFVCCMAPVHLRDRKTQHIQVVQKDMYAYKSPKCVLYAIPFGCSQFQSARNARDKYLS